MAARIVFAGVGGLGSNVATLVARLAPVTMELWDPGVLDEPDLNRQVLYTPQDLGAHKVERACRQIRAANPDVDVVGRAEPISLEAFGGSRFADPSSQPGGPLIIFDCLDTFGARQAVDGIARAHQAWVFHGGVEGWFGQATTIPPDTGGYEARFGVGYQDGGSPGKPIMPHVVAIIAALQVGELCRWAAAESPPLSRRFAVYDGMSQSIDHIDLAMPGDGAGTRRGDP